MSQQKQISNYGVWVCTPIRYIMEMEDTTPHIHLFFTDHKHVHPCRAAINVKSWTKESRLVFWLKRHFLHPITQELEHLTHGFHELSCKETLPSLEIGLDYIRTPGLIFPIGGTLLEHYRSGPHNDMLDSMEPILDRAIEEHATMYIFGSQFDSLDGIHEVHMNQGSLPRFPNDVGKDGALIIRFPDGHWEAVFLAFGSQRVPTDDVTGQPSHESESLVLQLGAVPLTPDIGPQE